MTTSVRAVLALMLLAGFYLLVSVVALFGGVGIVVSAMMVAQFVSGDHHSVPGAAPMLLAAFIPVVWAVLRGALAVSQPIGSFNPDSGNASIAVPEDSSLWSLVAELAGLVGVAPPSQVYLTSEANVVVREEARCLGLIGGRRTMDIGLPLLAALSPDQLRAVFCHELGHYSRKDTRLGAITYRGRVATHEISRQLTEVQQSRYNHAMAVGFATMFTALFTRYTRLYLRISTAVARRQELNADDEAARILQDVLCKRGESHGSGAQITGHALLITHAVPTAWQDFLIRHLNPMRRLNCVPDQPFVAFHLMITDSDYQKLYLEGFQHAALDQKTGPFDSHPSLTDRLHHLGQSTPCSASVSTEDNPLLQELDSLLARAGRQMFPTGATPGEPLPLTAWLDTAAEIRAIQQAKPLTEAAQSLDPSTQRPALATILELLAAGRSLDLATKLRTLTASPTSPTPNQLLAEHADLHQALRTLILHALVTTQGTTYTWKISWTGPSHFDTAHLDTAHLDQVITEALRGGNDVHYLTEHLLSLGLDPATTRLTFEPPTRSRQTGTSTPAHNADPAFSTDAQGADNSLRIQLDDDDSKPRRWPRITILALIVAVSTLILIAIADFSPNSSYVNPGGCLYDPRGASDPNPRPNGPGVLPICPTPPPLNPIYPNLPPAFDPPNNIPPPPTFVLPSNP